jgi:sucrose-6-phosphatase
MKYIATDLDKTLVPNGDAPYDNTLELFFKIVNEYNFGLIYITGRRLSLILKLIKDYNLKKPEFIISQVGTKIYSFENEPTELDLWKKHIETLNPDWDGQKIKDVLSEIPNLDLQEDYEQNDYKISFYIKDFGLAETIRDKVKEQLEKQKIVSNVILLKDYETKVIYLDVLPKGVNKYEAIKFLRGSFQFEDLVFAGDSGNDLEVLVSDIKSILVNNASQDFKNTVSKLNPGCLIASGIDGLNGNYSSGIIEGLVHYSWINLGE